MTLNREPQDATSDVDPDRFRDVMSHFASGVVVVTGIAPDGHPVGLTAQSFIALSLDPPLVMVSPARTSRTWPLIGQGVSFAINVLGSHQQELSRTFARSGTDKFAGIPWHKGTHGMPLLDGAIAHIECDIEAVYPGGDHYIAVGRVRDLDSHLGAPDDEPSPLLFYRSGYRALHPGAPMA